MENEPIETKKSPESLEEPELKELLENFRDALEDMPEIVGEMNEEMLFNNIESYEKLGKYQDKTWGILKERFNFDINDTGVPAKEYSIPGTPGSEGEGTIKVSLFETNDPNIFVGQYEYPNKDKWWSLRPEELEDEI